MLVRRQSAVCAKDVGKIERARELKLIVPDPSVLLSGLDAVTEKVIKRDQRRSFRIESAREAIKVDVTTTFEAVENLAILLESELQELVSPSWSTVGPKIKTVKGTPTGGKGGKNGKIRDDSISAWTFIWALFSAQLDLSILFCSKMFTHKQMAAS